MDEVKERFYAGVEKDNPALADLWRRAEACMDRMPPWRSRWEKLLHPIRTLKEWRVWRELKEDRWKIGIELEVATRRL